MAYIRPKRAISLKELEAGTVIDTDNVCEPLSDDECFDDEVSNNFISEMERLTTGEYRQTDNENDLSNLSLEELKTRMEPLTEDRAILKLVVQHGVGLVVPEKSIIFMHYNVSVEDSDDIFDSTYRRGKPHRFLLNAGHVITGLDIAVSTMRKGEVAKVWIRSDYAYREMGCPPRIPQNANLIYIVEILSFIESKDAIEFEEMTPEDQKKAPFQQVYNVSKIEHQLGNDMYKNNKYPAAIGRYQKAKRLLEDVSVANEDEDIKRSDLLLKIYLNLSLNYLKLKKYDRVIFFCRKALDIQDNNTKALFRLGKAFLMKYEFDLAKIYLLKAKHMEPYNADINKCLLELEEKHKKFNAWNRDFCKRMFGAGTAEEKEKLPESAEFIKVITDRIEQFKASDETEYSFSSGYTPKQLEVIESIAQSHDLAFISKIFQSQKIIKIMKKNPIPT